MSEPAEHLLAALEALETDGRLGVHERRWLRRGLRAYVDHGGAVGLEEALGLRGPGIRRPWTLWARWQRDAALRRALALCGDGSVWSRCARLADALAHGAPPGSALAAALAEARAAGLEVPSSQRRLYDLLKETPGAIRSVA